MGDEILLGTGSKILQYKNICSKCIIDAGAYAFAKLNEIII